MTKYAKDLTEEELKGKHICGISGRVFDTEEEYLQHTSEITGYKPTEPEHLGNQFLRQAKEALKRGGKLSKKEEKEIDKKMEDVKKDVQPKLDQAKVNAPTFNNSEHKVLKLGK